MPYDYITNLKGGNMKYILILLTLGINTVFAQTYVVTDPQGNVSYYVQKQGNQAQIVNNQGQVVQNATIYPNQVVTPQGWAVGTPSYTVPMSPPSPPSPRVLQ
jgi:Gpi18-like mannosyltransferase